MIGVLCFDMFWFLICSYLTSSFNSIHCGKVDSCKKVKLEYGGEFFLHNSLWRNSSQIPCKPINRGWIHLINRRLQDSKRTILHRTRGHWHKYSTTFIHHGWLYTSISLILMFNQRSLLIFYLSIFLCRA